MAKRFTDSEKWKDAWFMDLPSKYKLFWFYILDECDHAGIWKVNFKVSSFYIGEHLEHSEVKRILKDRITILNDDYWYINKFILYQYNTDYKMLNSKNKVHKSVLKILNKFDFFKPLGSPLVGVKDKDKDKDKDLVIDLSITYPVLELKEKYKKEKKVHEIICKKESITESFLLLKIEEFTEMLISQNRQSDYWSEYTRYFRNWIAKNKTTKNKNQRGTLNN